MPRLPLVALILVLPIGARAAEPPKADAWALRPVTRTVPPTIRNPQSAIRKPLDAFVLQRLEAEGLQFAPLADRATLIRRANFDLHGLPPTPEEIEAFVNDPAPDAWERLIDRLLASPRYGERWGRHWLDVARFAESQGFERDKIRDHAWRYRDFVIHSLNDDQPYDQFVREQIAGDVLPGATRESVAATGFLVAGPWDEAGSGSASALLRVRIREEELEDMVGTVAQTFMGLTVNCARCHDHKFDPIPQRDYYRMKSAFDGVRHGDRPLLTGDEQRRRGELISRLDREIAERHGRHAALERAARDRLTTPKSSGIPTGLPLPISRWTFDGDARDAIGSLHGTLRGPARIANGRLILNGQGAYVETAPLAIDLHEKTLEAWVALGSLTQRGGGVISVQTKGGGTFDAIVFGERQPGRWMAGSEGFTRTRDHDGAEENAGPGDLIHVVAVYSSDDRITVYRNGMPYFKGYRPSGADLRTYTAGSSQVLFGLRHTGAGNGYLTGEIEEARLYDKALTPEQIAESFRAGVASISQADLLAAMTADERRQWQMLRAELDRLRGERTAVPTVPLVYAANSKQPEPTSVLLRGDVEKKGETVSAGGLSSVRTISADLGLPPDAPEGERRLRFAKWLTDPKNPLTARVMVNRIWHYHFGRGLVETPNDFGINGGQPSHPELLDWLASEFIARGWSLKALHRLIMTSATYCQSSRFDSAAVAKDADNRLLWRFAPHRIEAESLRDSMLAVSGRLNPMMGGPGFRPFTVKVFNSTFYDLINDDRPEFNRRTVYRIGVNSAKDPLLESFDCPEPSVKTPRRNVTTTPIQALGLMNNPFVLRQAKYLAERIRGEVGGAAAAQVDRAYRLAFGRSPTAGEAERAAALVREHGLDDLCWALLNASEFMYVK